MIEAVHVPEGPRIVRGAIRSFLGERTEGPRADALNRQTGYAFAPDQDLDSLPRGRRRTVLHEAMTEFMGHSDWKEQVTQVIYDEARKDKAMAGFGYITRKEADIPLRAVRVIRIAEQFGMTDIDPARVFEMNFDAPWHHGEAYEGLLTTGMEQMLTKFFKENPEATVYMFVEDADMTTDGEILRNLGAQKIGSSVYLNKATPEDLSDTTLDSIWVVNKGMLSGEPARNHA